MKKLVGSVFLSKRNAFRKIKLFHLDLISAYTESVLQNKMPKIKQVTLDREKKLLETLQEFHNLDFDDKIDKLEFYCIEFGFYTSDKRASDFINVPKPRFGEI